MMHFPAADHAPGTMRDIHDFTSGVYLGQIPEAPHTYNVVGECAAALMSAADTAPGFMNEHQLAIGETTFDGLEELATQVSTAPWSIVYVW